MSVNLSLTDLPQREGACKHETVSWCPNESVGTPTLSVDSSEPIGVDVTALVVDTGIVVTVAAHVNATGVCVRCLTDITRSLDVDHTELFYLPETRDALVREGDEEAEDAFVIESDTLNIEPLLIDAIVPKLPFQPLCEPACPGLCPECGVRLAEAEAGHHHERIDERWSALAGLFDKETE